MEYQQRLGGRGAQVGVRRPLILAPDRDHTIAELVASATKASIEFDFMTTGQKF